MQHVERVEIRADRLGAFDVQHGGEDAAVLGRADLGDAAADRTRALRGALDPQQHRRHAEGRGLRLGDRQRARQRHVVGRLAHQPHVVDAELPRRREDREQAAEQAARRAFGRSRWPAVAAVEEGRRAAVGIAPLPEAQQRVVVAVEDGDFWRTSQRRERQEENGRNGRGAVRDASVPSPLAGEERRRRRALRLAASRFSSTCGRAPRWLMISAAASAEAGAAAEVEVLGEAGEEAGGEEVAGAGGVDHALDGEGRHGDSPPLSISAPSRRAGDGAEPASFGDRGQRGLDVAGLVEALQLVMLANRMSRLPSRMQPRNSSR